MVRHVVLVGLSGTGKSSVGREVALDLGFDLVDTDAEIERRTGRTIPDIFRTDGEPAFRAIESSVMRDALARDRAVIATGGGAVIDPSIWAPTHLGADSVLTVWLDGPTETLVDRLRKQAMEEGGAADRPLLAEGDPVAKIEAMRAARTPMYGRARVQIDIAQRSPASIAADIAEMARLGAGEESRFDLEAETARSAIRVGMGSRHRLGDVIGQRWPRAQRVWVMVDGNLHRHAGAELDALAGTISADVNVLPVAPGEGSKSLDGLSRLYDWMLGGGIERGDVVVALGGGVVGDLAGFAAASVLRGVGLVQVPTTLLSMVDSSVGGKTGINHAAGKNLIGAFYQPSEVVIDPELLQTLPPRELRSGWAEIIKHGVIEPSTPGGECPVLYDALERNAPALAVLSSPLTAWLIRRNVSLKAAVVQADERESGIRAYLNFGHTIGHGVEAAGYSLLHGEAVAVGMGAAMSIARDLDMVDARDEARLLRLISRFGLPSTAAVAPDVVREKMASDKKKAAGTQKWVLPLRAGGVTIRTDVPADVVTRAIARVARPG